ncbi:uncharacterized protein LOC143956921 isoform X6 [Lithobates pipiens]
MKILPKIQLCLLLLITLLEKAQQVTSNDNQTCNEQQYLEETLGRCCSRCEPGKYVKKECTETSDTECQPCEDGRYTSNWNYATRCMNCNSCDNPSWILPVLITVLFTVITISVIYIIHRKKSNIMVKLGCVAKIKKPLPESSGLEFVVTSPTTQEDQKELSYPMEETDPLQSAEYAP